MHSVKEAQPGNIEKLLPATLDESPLVRSAAVRGLAILSPKGENADPTVPCIYGTSRANMIELSKSEQEERGVGVYRACKCPLGVLSVANEQEYAAH